MKCLDFVTVYDADDWVLYETLEWITISWEEIISQILLRQQSWKEDNEK